MARLLSGYWRKSVRHRPLVASSSRLQLPIHCRDGGIGQQGRGCVEIGLVDWRSAATPTRVSRFWRRFESPRDRGPAGRGRIATFSHLKRPRPGGTGPWSLILLVGGSGIEPLTTAV